VLERTAYRGWLESQKDGSAKLHHVEELQSVLESSPAPDLATWLIDMHLGDVDGPAFGGTQATLLSTIHGAKGGEWPVVFVVGCEEGLIPQARPADTGVGRLEPRRPSRFLIALPPNLIERIDRRGAA